MRIGFNTPFTLVATLLFSAMFIFLCYYILYVRGSTCAACQ